MTKPLNYQVITDKKELIEKIGEWTTVETGVKYEVGANEITLYYEGNTITFKNKVKTVAYIASQFWVISNEQYAKFI